MVWNDVEDVLVVELSLVAFYYPARLGMPREIALI